MSDERTRNFTTRIGGRAASMLIRAWMSTLSCRAAFEDPSVDPALPGGGSRIYLFWHENILLPLYLRGGCKLAILLSRHRDADILAEVAKHCNFECVRGSTFRGAAPSIRELLQKGREMHLAITPDGPRGPRRRLAQGPIYLASKLEMPIVAIGVGYDRPWRAPTWDRFAVPRPFHRARTLVSRAIPIPPELTRVGLEDYRLRIESLLNRLSENAARWAATGERHVQEVPITRIKGPRRAA